MTKQLTQSGPNNDEIMAWATECAKLTNAGLAHHYWVFDIPDYVLFDVVRAAVAQWKP
jgi:hypothetical protein